MVLKLLELFSLLHISILLATLSSFLTLNVVLGKDTRNSTATKLFLNNENQFNQNAVHRNDVNEKSVQHRILKKKLMSMAESNVQNEIELLREKDKIQEKLLQEAAQNVDFLKGQMSSPLRKIDSLNQQPKQSRRSRRSIQSSVRLSALNDDRRTQSDEASAVSSSWSKLQISPEELGSMPYGDYGINIYGHSANNLQLDNAKKRFYYSPISLLNHESVTSSFHNITKQPEVRFRVEMWNENIEKEIRKYTSELVHHPLSPGQIRVLPLEKVMLSPVSHLQARLPYQIAKAWFDYQRHKSVTFTLTCPTIEDCNELASQMRSHPQQFDHFKLLCSLSSQTSERREVTIRLENIITGDMMSKLNQRYPNADTVILTAEDEKHLFSEMVSNIMIETFDDFSVVSPYSEQNVYNILKNLLESSSVAIQEQKEEMWNSVFWEEDNYRPDRVAKTLNEMYNKLDSEQQQHLSESLSDRKNAEASLNLGLFGINANAKIDFENSTKFSKDELNRLLDESKKTVVWEGEKFVPKQMQLSRINVASLKDFRGFQERNVKVAYTTAILSVAVNVKENIGSEFVDEIFDVKTKLKDLTDNIAARFKRRVYFYVQRSSSFSASNSAITFDLERLNIGKAMDLVKGVFTVPMNGTYQFSFSGMKDSSAITLNVQLRLNKEVIGTASAERNGFFTLALKSTLRLAAGDQISLWKNGNGILKDDENHYTHFTGNLLEEDLDLLQ